MEKNDNENELSIFQARLLNICLCLLTICFCLLQILYSIGIYFVCICTWKTYVGGDIMTKNKLWICVASFLTCAMIATAVVVNGEFMGGIGGARIVSGNEPEFTTTLGNYEFSMSNLTTTYQQSVTYDVDDSVDYSPVFNFFLAKLDADDNLVLAPNGKIFNFDSNEVKAYGGKITNIKSVTVSYEGGSLFIQEGIAGEGTTYGPKASLSSETPYLCKSNPNYFMISNSTAETTITEISVTYACTVPDYSVARLGETYRGKGTDGNTYHIVRSNVDNISMPELSVDGAIEVDAYGSFVLTLSDGAIVYTGSVSADYHTLTFTGKSGSSAASAPDIAEMNRVYVVDDFESYTSRGTGYTESQLSAFTASNLRGTYWVDSGSGTGDSWIYKETGRFKMPNTDNYLNLTTLVKHGGSKAMLFQGRKDGWVRLWSSEVWNQNQHYNFGRGNRFSFWVYSARNNNDGSGQNASNVQIRAQVYYKNFTLTDSSRNPGAGDNGSGTKDFTITSGSGWNECVVNINSEKTVYAINIMINNSGLATDYVFMPIDDITIYTEPEATKKYNETSTLITKSYHGTVNLSGGLKYTIKVGLGANGYVYAYAGANMEPTSYTIDGSTITIPTTGSVTVDPVGTLTFGTWSGTLSNNNSTITIPKANITGSIADYITDSSITLVEDTRVLDGSEANLAGIESKVLRQYYDTSSSSWKTDSGNSNRFELYSDSYIEGNKSVKVRPFSSEKMRVILNPTVAAAYETVDSVAFWFFVPDGFNYHISIFTYKDSTPSSTSGRYAMPFDRTYNGSNPEEAGWHYINMGLDVKGGYGRNFAITVHANANPSVFDYITAF